MMNILLIAICVVNLLNLLVLVLFLRHYNTIRQTFSDFIMAEDDKTPSPFANLVSTISDVFSRSISAVLKTTFMGVQSGAVRGERAVDADIAEDMISLKSPMLGAVLKSFPSLRRTLRRNPELIDIATEKLLKSQTGASPTNGGQSDFKFKF